MAVPVLTLPPELIQPIMDSGVLNKADLCSVALASRFLREEGQRIIFRDPGLVLGQVDAEIRQAIAFFDTIISSPHRLALMVRTYTQATNWAVDEEGDEAGVLRRKQEEMFKKMTEALKLLINLTVFHSRDIGRSNDFTARTVVDCLCRCSFRLKELSWRHGGEEIRLLEEFLAPQDGIESLYFYPGFDLSKAFDADNTYIQRLLTAGKNACPKLETLYGPMSSSRVFLPGKQNLKFVGWTWALYITEALDNMDSHITKVCDALRSLQLLRYESSEAAGLPFVKIAPYLNNLVVLVISNDHLEEVCELSHGLPVLRAIHFFNEGFWNFSTPQEFARDCTLIPLIFALCGKLKLIDVDRHLDRSPPHDEDYNIAYGLTSRRFEVSPDTGELVMKRVDRSEENWWEDRVYLVAKLSTEA